MWRANITMTMDVITFLHLPLSARRHVFSFGTLSTFNNKCFLYSRTRAKKWRPIRNTLKITILIRKITNAVFVIKLSSGRSPTSALFYLFFHGLCSCYKMRRRVAFLWYGKPLHVGWNSSCNQYLCSSNIYLKSVPRKQIKNVLTLLVMSSVILWKLFPVSGQ